MSSTALLPRVSPLFQTPKRPRALSPEQVLEIRAAFEDGTSARILASRYGISHSVAHRVATHQIYTDVIAQPRIAWFDPTVRRRGVHNDDELRAMVAMLRQHKGKWALVKKTLTKPAGEPYDRWGMEVSVIKVNHTEWGLYVRWPLPTVTCTPLAM